MSFLALVPVPYLVMFFLCATDMAVILIVNKPRSSRTLQWVLRVIAFDALYFFIIPSALIIAWEAGKLYFSHHIEPSLSEGNKARISIAIGALLLGYGAYAFQKKWPRIYGGVEIVFAAALALKASENLDPIHPNAFTAWMALLGSMYVVANGVTKIKSEKQRG
jgi:hypothetical protein